MKTSAIARLLDADIYCGADLMERELHTGVGCDLMSDVRAYVEEQALLLTGTDISVIELPQLAAQYGGLCWPAHVDRDVNGLFAVLGTRPDELQAPAAEIRQAMPEAILTGLKIVQASDAHDLQTLMDAGFEMPLESADFEELYRYITGEKIHDK